MNPDSKTLVPDEDFREQLRSLHAKLYGIEHKTITHTEIPIDALWDTRFPLWVRAHQLITMVVKHRKGGVRTEEIQNALGINRATAKNQLVKLAAKGLVERRDGVAYLIATGYEKPSESQLRNFRGLMGRNGVGMSEMFSPLRADERKKN